MANNVRTEFWTLWLDTKNSKWHEHSLCSAQLSLVFRKQNNNQWQLQLSADAVSGSCATHLNGSSSSSSCCSCKNTNKKKRKNVLVEKTREKAFPVEVSQLTNHWRLLNYLFAFDHYHNDNWSSQQFSWSSTSLIATSLQLWRRVKGNHTQLSLKKTEKNQFNYSELVLVVIELLLLLHVLVSQSVSDRVLN